MVSANRVLAVILMGLALVHCGHTRAADEPYVCVLRQPGFETATKADRLRATSPAKRGVGIQDQVPVSAKGTPTGKTVGVQNPIVVSAKGTPTGKLVNVQDPVPVSAKGNQGGKVVSAQNPVPVSAKGALAGKSVGIQDQIPARPRIKVGKDAQQAEVLPQ